ncbi:MAG: hypothetical protein KDA63_15665 [Planctomycetales bacterium]|nr:hypothetical protein [Planctomycetales bacterium]
MAKTDPPIESNRAAESNISAAAGDPAEGRAPAESADLFESADLPIAAEWTVAHEYKTDDDPANPGVEPYPVSPLDDELASPVLDVRLCESAVRSSAPAAEPSPRGGPVQFTLPTLLALTLVAGLVFAVMRAVPAGLFAATLGMFLALAALAGITRTQFGSMVWWTLLGLYGTAVIVLLARS